MVRLKIDIDALGFSSAVERLSGVVVKDCFLDEDTWYVVVPAAEVGRVIGKRGMFVQQLQNRSNKKVKVVAFNDNPLLFVQSFIAPLEVKKIEERGNEIIIVEDRGKIRSLLIGRGGKNLAVLNLALQRFFPDRTVKVM